MLYHPETIKAIQRNRREIKETGYEEYVRIPITDVQLELLAKKFGAKSKVDLVIEAIKKILT